MLRLFSTVKEVWEFLRYRKKWWLAPVMLLLILLGGIIVISAGSPLAPFIYTLF